MSYLRKVLVVVATYNERENLRPLLDRILSVPLLCDVLVVDDNSPDGTGQAAEDVAVTTPKLHVLHRPSKLGLGPALTAGFSWAIEHEYDRILNIDGDLSHDPGDIPRLVARSENADLVIGSRYAGGIRVVNWPLHRLVLSLSAAKYVRRVTAMPIYDPTSGFRCFQRSALEAINLGTIYSTGYFFHVETLHRVWCQGYSIVEEPIIFTDRRNGTTKMSPKIVVEATWRTWQLCLEHRFRRRPRRLEGLHVTEPGKMK